MNSITVFDFQSQGIRFEQRGDRTWVSLTDMAKASDKQVNDYTRLKSTTEYVQALEGITGIPVMVSKVGGSPETTGTWAIDEVAIDFAAWCNVELRIWVNRQIKTLLTTGKVELEPRQPRLYFSMERAIAVNTLAASLQAFDMDLVNPRFKQSLQDLVGDMLGLNQPALPATTQEVWLGVAERAEQLGYPIALVTQHRSQLGKAISKVGLMKKQEKRLCGGTQRPINLYLKCDELDAAIARFFQLKLA